MKVIEYLPFALKQAKDHPNSTQTELTTFIWGTSGVNSPHLVSLLNVMVDRKLLTLTKKGRSKRFSITPKGELHLQSVIDKGLWIWGEEEVHHESNL